MQANTKQTVGEVVAENYRATDVFREFGLNFCCDGNQTIEEASSGKGIEPKLVKKALENVNMDDAQQNNYDEWPADVLVDYIINKHHKNIRQKLPVLSFYAERVVSVHRQNHPELEEIYYELVMFYIHIVEHMNEEEAILFPYIKKLVHAVNDKHLFEAERFEEVANHIAIMRVEHDKAGESMTEIRRLSINFIVPVDASETYHLLFKNLQLFEKDFHKHVHVENNISLS